MAEMDLFGEAPAGLPTAKGRGPKGGKRYTLPAGYAALPGTGPAGETCGSCKYMARCGNGGSKTWRKCELMQLKWTGGPKTDVLARSPACRRWEAAERAKA